MEGTATWIEDEAYDDVNDSLGTSRPARWGSRRSRSTATPGSDARDVDLLALPGRVLRRGDPGERDRSRDVEPCRRVAGRPRPLLDPGGRAGDRREDRERHAVEASVGLRRLRRLEQPAGEVLRRGASYPGAGRAEQDPHEGHAVVRLEHDARPLTNRSVAIHRGSNLSATARLKVVVDGPGYGTGPEASLLVIRKTGVSSVRSVILNSNGNGQSRSPSVRRSRASS